MNVIGRRIEKTVGVDKFCKCAKTIFIAFDVDLSLYRGNGVVKLVDLDVSEFWVFC